MKERYARVALPIPLGQAFSYRVPGEFPPLAGRRVLVELGRRKCLGVVIDEGSELPVGLSPEKVKAILSVLDERAALPDELRIFLGELARYYISPVGEVFRLALPALERATAEELEKSAGRKLKAVGRLVQFASATAKDPGNSLPRGHAAALFERLVKSGPEEVSVLTQEFSTARNVLKKLVALGLVELDRREQKSDPFFAHAVNRDTPPQLNQGQSQAVRAIVSALDEGEARHFLLDGVTASGKTEVYLHAAAHTLSQGRGVILLVPEIALTPQLVERFRARLGDSIAVLHSGLSEQARLSMWRSLRSGDLKVVVGARSALFAPVVRLGLICVDEEHDGSYKQEEGVRYNARDMALLRAHRAGAACVLGSATPSLHSEMAVTSGRLQRLQLPDRAHHAATLPGVELIDLTRTGAGPSGDPLISLPLHRALEENLAQKGQTILFLNRRGFAPSLVCESCGTTNQCPHCSVALTVHRHGRAKLSCHYCDYETALPERCSACGGARFCEEGSGTERIEDLLKKNFPTARVARMDRDVASGKKSEAIVARMRAGEIDILVGTQMVTKGHDLPGVTLVGVLNADTALSMPDFRASERTFHLLVQVAGRAGRAGAPGRVLIQTRSPEHPAIQSAKHHDVRSFIKNELLSRRELNYPPFSHVALVRLDGKDEAEVASEAKRLALLVEELGSKVQILGPAPAPIARLRDRYRYRFMLRSSERGPLRAALLCIVRAPLRRRVHTTVDVDPLNML